MHDLQFSNLFPILRWDHLTKRSYTFKACSDAAAKFTVNMGITHAMGMIPGYAFMNGEVWKSAVLHGMAVIHTDDPENPKILPHAVQYFDEHDTKSMD